MLLHHGFLKTAKKNGSKTAIIDRTTGKEVTYDKALIASLILAGKFGRYDGGFLGIMIPTSAGCALSILGALMSGRTPVMINYSTSAAQNAEYAQKKCGFRTIVTSRALLEKIDCRHVEGMVYIEDIMASISTLTKLQAALKSKLPLSVLLKRVHGGKMDDDCVVLFTSGSEKDPKGVPLSHRNISSNVKDLGQMFDLSTNDRFLANLPYFHVFGLTAGLWVPFHFGMTLITYANPLDYKKVCDIVREDKVTLMVGTPSFFWGYLKKSTPGDFKSVRIALAGADKCPDALRDGFLQKHQLTLLEAYGTTETSPAISANTPASNRPGSVGKAMPAVQIRIENLETGEVASTNEVGKILVKGDPVMKGYYNDLEETSLRLKRGWYDTGDMGFLDKDGYLWHAGRLKRFVKIGGEMISLVQVENALEKLLPEDISCCIVEVPDALKGAKIIAVVTEKIDEKKMKKSLAQDLPNIAIPKQFMVIEDLPLMGTGKIDFRGVTAKVRERLLTS